MFTVWLYGRWFKISCERSHRHSCCHPKVPSIRRLGAPQVKEATPCCMRVMDVDVFGLDDAWFMSMEVKHRVFEARSVQLESKPEPDDVGIDRSSYLSALLCFH